MLVVGTNVVSYGTKWGKCFLSTHHPNFTKKNYTLIIPQLYAEDLGFV